jgi:hypothetical protein
MGGAEMAAKGGDSFGSSGADGYLKRSYHGTHISTPAVFLVVIG